MIKTDPNTVVILVAMYRYYNFPIRIMHSLLEDIDNIKPYTIFFKNCETNIFDFPTKKEEDLFVNNIIELNPRVVGISVLSPYVPIAKRLTELIHDNSSALVIWGGIHPTISPESCIKDTDIICIGEGEGAIVELAKHLRDGDDYFNIQNLWINNNKHINKNPLRPLIQDIDSLPFPSYGNESFYFINGNKITRKDPTLFDPDCWIQTSRGCPFVCSYCVNSLLKPMFNGLGNYTRRKSVSNIIREIKEHLQKSNLKEYVYFADEVFGCEDSWLNEFNLSYKREVGLPFYVEYNPTLINSTMLRKLIDSGVHTINFGIQTGSDYIRNHIFHRPGTNKELINLANEIHNYGVKIKYDLIINNPYDTEESLKETIINLLQLPKPLFFNLYSLQFFPDYPLTRKAIKDGYINAEDTTVEKLMQRTTRRWSFLPTLFPYTKKQVLQNIIWLVVWNHATNKIINYSILSESLCSRFVLFYLNIKAVFLGKITAILLKHILILKLINSMKYLLKGDIKTLFLKIRKRLGKVTSG